MVLEVLETWILSTLVRGPRNMVPIKVDPDMGTYLFLYGPT